MTNYQLVTNAVQPQQVRETDSAYIIEDVPFVRPMELAGGYVPEQSIRETADEWVGVPVTLQHPRDESGTPVAANRQPEIHLGVAEDPRYDGEHVRANIRIEKDRLAAVDGADAVERKLAAGEPIDVSSQYAAVPLEAGEYDGEHRQNVEAIQRPDSIAILPNQRGQCSIEDGCGIDPQLAANAEVSIPMTHANATHGEDMDAAADAMVDFDGTAEGTLDESAIPNDEFAAHYAFPGETKSESSFPLVDADGNLRRGNVAAAFRFRDDAPDTEALVELLADLNDEFDDPPIEPESLEDAMSANAGLGGWLKSFLGLTNSNQTTPAESGVGWSPSDGAGYIPTEEDGNTSDMQRDELITDIVSNSALTRATLTDRCDEGLQAIHDDVVANDDDAPADDGAAADDTPSQDADTDTTADTDTMTDDKIGLDDLTDDAKEALVEQAAERIEANRQAEKKDELAAEIVANSAEYEDTEAVREDYPTVPALEAKRDSLQSSGMPPAGTAMDDMTPNSGDDLDEIDVSSGILGGEH